MKVFISTSSFGKGSKAPLELLEEKGLSYKLNPLSRRLTEEEIIQFLCEDEYSGLIAGLEPLNRNVLSSQSHLKALARVGIGVSNVDFTAAKDLGIKVSNTPDEPTEAVAEMALTNLLSLLRESVPMNSALHEGRWEKKLGLSLKNKNILFIGYGRIGQKFAANMALFKVNKLIYDPFIKKEDLVEEESLVSLEEGLKQADIVTLHASGEEVILGESAFQLMKEDVVILNCARGGLIDEGAMVQALDKGKIRGVWVDTFVDEPYSGPLCDFPNVILTPHASTYTKECRNGMEMAAVNNILRDLKVG